MKKQKPIILRIILIMGKIIFGIILLIGILILSIGFMYLIGLIQDKLTLPQEYIMSIFKYPFSRLIFIYELYIIFGFFYVFNKNSKEALRWFANLKNGFIRKHKKWISVAFITLNIVILYTILFNVSVITSNKIIDYTFFIPQGRVYNYNDIVKIETGIYGKKRYSSIFSHYSRGDFYYIIQLNDGTRIDLTDVGGIKNDDDPRFIIERLDNQYVNMGISKVSSMDNFEYCTKNLGKIYTDKIRSILLNVK